MERTADVADHRAGISVVLDALTDHATGIIRDPAEIDAVGHRMVLAGPSISGPVVFDEALVRLVERHTRLAPLHNPPTLAGYRAAAEVLPAVPHVGVFDTAFYAALPARSYVYAIPYEYYERHGIRRFGFHGMSHQYVSRRAAEFLGRDPADFRCVTCHLGNGASVAGREGRKARLHLARLRDRGGSHDGHPLRRRRPRRDPLPARHAPDVGDRSPHPALPQLGAQGHQRHQQRHARRRAGRGRRATPGPPSRSRCSPGQLPGTRPRRPSGSRAGSTHSCSPRASARTRRARER